MAQNNHKHSKFFAWVVFTGQTDMYWLRFFKPGFRHCFVLLHDGTHWLSVDPLSNYMDIAIHNHLPASFDLPLWLGQRALVAALLRMIERGRQS
jgi:hypothetical protein